MYVCLLLHCSLHLEVSLVRWTSTYNLWQSYQRMFVRVIALLHATTNCTKFRPLCDTAAFWMLTYLMFQSCLNWVLTVQTHEEISVDKEIFWQQWTERCCCCFIWNPASCFIFLGKQALTIKVEQYGASKVDCIKEQNISSPFGCSVCN